MIELRTLGTLELRSIDGSGLGAVLAQPRRSALLCYLALARPHGFQRRDTLYALFWPEHDAKRAHHALRQSLYFLRHVLGTGAILSRGDDLALDAARVRCDAAEFERSVAQGRLEAALALYQGELLPGFHISGAPAFERWLDQERCHLAALASEAAWALADARERDGDSTGAVAWARRAAALTPADEMGLRRLVLLLDRVGDRAAAVRAFQAFARTLESEYELPLSDATLALRERLRAGWNEDHQERREAVRDPQPTPIETMSSGDAPEGGIPITAPESRRVAVVRWGRWSTARVRAGVLLALLGAGTWWVARQPDPTPVTRERVIVGDFANFTSDSTFGDLVAHVLRAELARSPVLSVAGQSQIAETLRRMRAEPDAALRGEVAREVAIREEVKVLVEGEVRAVGAGLVLQVSVVEAVTGEIIHGATELVPDSTRILPAIGRISDEIRRSVGESVASVRAADSLWSFTTSTLPALRKHMAGTHTFRRGNYRGAIRSLEEAVALDPEFAHAHLLLYGLLEHAGLPKGRYLPHLLRAYELRGGLTNRERYAIEGSYHREATGDIPLALAAFQRHLDAVEDLPSHEGGWYTRFARTLVQSGDLVEAERILREARARYPIAINYVLLVEVLYAMGREAGARVVLAEARRQYPDHPEVELTAARMLAVAGRVDEAHDLAGRVRADLDLENGLRLQAELDARRGRLTEAVGHLKELQGQLLSRGNRAVALEVAIATARLRLIAGDLGGITDLERLLAQHSLDSLDVLSRPYLPLALLYARAARPRQARAWLTAYEQRYPHHLTRADGRTLHHARAAVYLAEGHPAGALRELALAARFPADGRGVLADPFLPAGDHPELARVYERLGAADSAVAVYERYLAVRSLRRSATDATELAESLERLAGLHERRRNASRAAAIYQRFQEQWRDADPALQPRVASARQRTAALEKEGFRATR